MRATIPSRFALGDLLGCALDPGFPTERILELQIDIRSVESEREFSRIVVAQRMQIDHKSLFVLPASLGRIDAKSGAASDAIGSLEAERSAVARIRRCG